ncbi:MAG TPA: VanZ family protein [Anaerohalosphaeraceae bacterium]|nr:VanZ family protein [Anaerohalosphaeraceae bacterium]
MALKRRHQYILLAAGIYWPLLFWLTHIPIPEIARRSGMSDKLMHFAAYLALAFLTWLAFSPYEKVRWNRPLVWMVLLGLAGYAAFDEWLQGRPFIGRSADWRDFAANLAGIGAGLGILTFFSFWPALPAVSALFILFIQNHSNLLFLQPEMHLEMFFHFTAYSAFTLIWMHFLSRKRPVRTLRGFLKGLAVPMLLVFGIWLEGRFVHREPDRMCLFAAFFAIVSSLVISTAVLSRRPWDDKSEGRQVFTPGRKNDTDAPAGNRE